MAAQLKKRQNPYLEAIRAYKEYSEREVERVRRNLTGLSADDKSSLVWPLEDQVKQMDEAVRANVAVLEKVAQLLRDAPAWSEEDDKSDFLPGVKPVQTLLQTLTREWSKEGEEERAGCFDRLLGSLEEHLKVKADELKAAGEAPPRVLCPGANLGRLPFEVQSRGYACSGCEARVLHFYGTEFIRQHGSVREAHRIQPYALNTCNRFKMKDHVRSTPVPETEVRELPEIRLGDFLQLYDAPTECGAYDAVLTAFSLDATSNVLRFIRTVAHAVRPGGLWANFGPLAYDTEHDEEHGSGIELSWEELRHAISHFFVIGEESFVDSSHAENAASMMQIEFSCIFFRAVRNTNAATGIGVDTS